MLTNTTNFASTSTWTALPKLILTVASLSIIFLAGQMAQSRGHDIIRTGTQEQTGTAITTHTRQATHGLTPAERYARSQIQTFTDVLDGLTERAEVIMETSVVPTDDARDLKLALRQLDEDLMRAREASARFGKTHDKFAGEDLRESLMAAEDSASRAQGQLITLDQNASDQGFRVSRTGQ